MPLLLDFESRSDAELKDVGGRLYWEHPSTEALCCVAFDTTDGALLAWTPGDHDVAAEIVARAKAHNWAAHNATGFDRFAMRRVFRYERPGLDWIDTSELARTAGLPGALDALGTRWLGLPKDKAASGYVMSLSRRNKAGQWPAPDMGRVLPYCVSDVEIIAEGWERLEPWLSLEPDVVRVDRIVNERGIGFDVQLAKRLLEIDAELCDRAVTEAARLAGWTVERTRQAAASPKQFKELTALPDAKKPTVGAALMRDDLLTPAGLALCRARRAVATIARGKLAAGLARVSDDGRLRDTLRYYGAHTGRWSGRGMQLQNLPRPDRRFEDLSADDVCRLADRVLAGETLPDAAHVDLLLRACLVAAPGKVLIARDYSSVEPRALAWWAGDRIALGDFAAGRDSYKVAASSIYGVPYDAITKAQRQTGKIAVLALGYQGGPRALESMARQNGVDLNAPGIPSPKQIVAAWCAGRPDVTVLWRRAGSAFTEAVVGGRAVRASACSFEPWPRANGVAIVLPSGRPIVYNDAAWTHEGLTYAGAMKREKICDGKIVEKREKIYGGKIVENVIQGLCRDLLATAMVTAEDAGLPVALTVHDEIVCEVDARHAAEAAAELDRIMCRAPEWAQGMPIIAAGFVARRYRK